MALKFPVFPRPSYIFEEEFLHRTLISNFENGAEQRRSKWSQGKKVFSLKYNPVYREEFFGLWQFYQLCRGAQKEFDFILPVDPDLPYEQVTGYWPLHEGEGAKVDDWNGFIYPTYKCRFIEDRLSYEQFSYRLIQTGLKIIQVSPVIYTNNYGTITGAVWAECPDGSACIDFDGIDDQISMGNVSALNVGTGSFSFAFAVYADSLAAQIGVLSKKASDLASALGYHLVIGTNGQITVRLSDGTNQNTIQSATGAIPLQTWRIVTVAMNRPGTGQIYVNNSPSGSSVSLTAGNADNTRSFFLGRAEGIAYGNCKMRNFLFAKKAWTQAERDRIWNTWRGIFQL